MDFYFSSASLLLGSLVVAVVPRLVLFAEAFLYYLDADTVVITEGVAAAT